jgi:shikimate kinase
MPGCGKTTVARAVSERLGRKWYDVDACIEASEGICVSEIFKRFGEEYFRRLETDKLLDLSSKTGAVISTGGGAVVRNAALLRLNSIVFWLTRPLDAIAACVEPGGERPLLRDSGSLRELYDARRALYAKTCDFIIDNSGAPEDAAERVLEALGKVENSDN